MSTTMTTRYLTCLTCCGLWLIAVLSACTTQWRDETKGLDTATQTTTTTTDGGTGGGGGDPCSSCDDFFTASSTCQAPDCPSADEVCSGTSRVALDAFFDCVFCNACSAQCPDLCGSDDLNEVSGACEGCLIGTLGGACANEYATCTGS